MSYVTQEYTILVGKHDSEDVTIKPNVPFEAFEGKYVVTAYARVVDPETEEIIILAPGQTISGIGKVKPKEAPRHKRKAPAKKQTEDTLED